MESSRLLINEPPLQVLPSLVRTVGLNEAIILQQMQYWLFTSNNKKDGHVWIYNSYKNWVKQFPWLKERTLRLHFSNLEKKGIVISGQLSIKVGDNTKWYRIDYDRLEQLLYGACGKKVRVVWQETAGHVAENATSTLLQETTTENTTESVVPHAAKLSRNPNVAALQQFLGFPEKTDRDPVPNPAKEATFIAKMKRRGYDWDRDIFPLWKKKVENRHVFVSMRWVNEDIGKEIGNVEDRQGAVEDSDAWTKRLQNSVGTPLS